VAADYASWTVGEIWRGLLRASGERIWKLFGPALLFVIDNLQQTIDYFRILCTEVSEIRQLSQRKLIVLLQFGGTTLQLGLAGKVSNDGRVVGAREAPSKLRLEQLCSSLRANLSEEVRGYRRSAEKHQDQRTTEDTPRPPIRRSAFHHLNSPRWQPLSQTNLPVW